jgi:hypothetical protein
VERTRPTRNLLCFCAKVKSTLHLKQLLLQSAFDAAKFFFGLGGLEIEPVQITLKETKEEFFAEMMKKFSGA